MIDDRQIMCALIDQVAKAVPDGKSELAVTTVVTRPMWNAWCNAVGIQIGSEPSEWIGVQSRRIYGSRTVVVDSDVMASASFVAA